MTTLEEQLRDRGMDHLGIELAGENAVTRHVLRRAPLNADELASLKTAARHLDSQSVLINAALATQDGRLTLLTKEVTALRREVTALRRRHETMDGRLDRIGRDVAAILAAVAPPAPPA